MVGLICTVPPATTAKPAAPVSGAQSSKDVPADIPQRMVAEVRGTQSVRIVGRHERPIGWVSVASTYSEYRPRTIRS
jgi:hypothetical protein